MSAFLQRFRVNQHLLAIYTCAQRRGTVSELLEAFDSLDTSYLGLSAVDRGSFTASEYLDEKLSVLFKYFHMASEQLPLQTSSVNSVIAKLRWLEPDAARVIECTDRIIDERTHGGPEAVSSGQLPESGARDQATHGL